MSQNLKQQLIRLGHTNPELRPHLTPVLDTLTGRKTSRQKFATPSDVQRMVQTLEPFGNITIEEGEFSSGTRLPGTGVTLRQSLPGITWFLVLERPDSEPLKVAYNPQKDMWRWIDGQGTLRGDGPQSVIRRVKMITMRDQLNRVFQNREVVDNTVWGVQRGYDNEWLDIDFQSLDRAVPVLRQLPDDATERPEGFQKVMDHLHQNLNIDIVMSPDG